MKLLSTFALLLTALSCILLASGCGSGKGSDIIDQGSGTISSSDIALPNNRYADTLSFQSKRDSYICVEMMSTAFDPQVGVWRGTAHDPDVYTWIGQDDDSGDGLNARFNFYGTNGSWYTVRFTTYGQYSYGSYTWTIRYVDVPVSASATAEKSPVHTLSVNDYIQVMSH